MRITKKGWIEKEIQYWSSDRGEQFPKGLHAHGGRMIDGHAEIGRQLPSGDDTILVRRQRRRAEGIVSDVSTFSQGPHAFGVDVLGADPFIFLLLVPLKTIRNRLIASKQTAEVIDERPPVTTSATSTPPDLYLPTTAAGRSPAPTPTPAPTAAAAAATPATATIARPTAVPDS